MKGRIAYCGIDVGLKKHSICLMNSEQKIVKKYDIANDIDGFKRLEADIDIDKKAKICLEPTGVYSINIFLYLKNKGYDIRFCQTDSSHDFRQAMFRQKKHDYFDSVALAKYRIVNEHRTFDGSNIIEKLALDNYYYNSDYQLLSDMTDEYVRTRRQISILKNKIKNIIDLRFPESIQIFSSDRGCKTIMRVLSHSKEDILSGKIKVMKLTEIQNKLRHSIGQYNLKVTDFKNYSNELTILEKKIKKLNSSIKEKLHDLGYSFLFDYYGLNTINIAVLIKEIRNIKRFYRFSENGSFNKKRSLKAFKKFLGIAVTSNQSGAREGGHALIKSGNIKLRNIIFMLALNYIGDKPNPTRYNNKSNELDPYRFRMIYERLVEKGTKKLIALTKIMNKIATDLFFILKRNAEANKIPDASCEVVTNCVYNIRPT
jgi:hypothetical protein